MNTPNPTRPELDQSGTADYLGVAVRTLENWRCRRYGPRYVKIGGSVRYRQSDLDAWLAAQTVDPTRREASSQAA